MPLDGDAPVGVARNASAGRPSYERGDDIGGVPVQRHPCAVVPHCRARVGVGRRLLHVAERHPGIESCRDEGVPECVRTHGLEVKDPSTPSDASDDPAGSVAIEAAAVATAENRALATLADCKVDGAGGAWGDGDGDDLAALAHDGQSSMSPLEAECLDIGTGRLRDPQSVERENERRACSAAAPSPAATRRAPTSLRSSPVACDS